MQFCPDAACKVNSINLNANVALKALCVYNLCAPIVTPKVKVTPRNTPENRAVKINKTFASSKMYNAALVSRNDRYEIQKNKLYFCLLKLRPARLEIDLLQNFSFINVTLVHLLDLIGR